MKLLIKKLYCPSCQRLVTGREQKANNTTRVLCSRCGRGLMVSDGIKWRRLRESN